MDVPSAREDETPAAPLTQPVPVRALPTGASPAGQRARQWNRWRERYNPLRGLNVARCVTLLEQYQRGEMADPQWAYYFIEQSDADLFALLERREAALLQLDWNIKTAADRGRTPGDEGLAREQCAALREAYESVDNLYEAIAHLQLATFRGFAHCEKYRRRDGAIFHLELVDQWNVVRDLLRGAWKYNPDALSTTFESISDDNLLDPANFLIRERDRHVNRLALLKFIRTNLSEKDWDAFIEIYGIPSGVVIGPAGVPPESEAEYKASAQAIAEGGSGYLPHGSDYKPNDQPRGSDPFRPRLDYLTEKLVLAGTGGLLTMLAQSGSGTLAGGAHAEAFATIARAEARKISEIFQRQFDREVLARHFPGCPTVAYFDLAAQEERDPGAVAGLAQKLAAAGYRIDVAQLAEKTGYKLVDTQAKANTSPATLRNLDRPSIDDLLCNAQRLTPEEIERWVTIDGHRVPIRKKRPEAPGATSTDHAHRASVSGPGPRPMGSPGQTGEGVQEAPTSSHLDHSPRLGQAVHAIYETWQRGAQIASSLGADREGGYRAMADALYTGAVQGIESLLPLVRATESIVRDEIPEIARQVWSQLTEWRAELGEWAQQKAEDHVAYHDQLTDWRHPGTVLRAYVDHEFGGLIGSLQWAVETLDGVGDVLKMTSPAYAVAQPYVGDLSLGKHANPLIEKLQQFGNAHGLNSDSAAFRDGHFKVQSVLNILTFLVPGTKAKNGVAAVEKALATISKAPQGAKLAGDLALLRDAVAHPALKSSPYGLSKTTQLIQRILGPFQSTKNLPKHLRALEELCRQKGAELRLNADFSSVGRDKKTGRLIVGIRKNPKNVDVLEETEHLKAMPQHHAAPMSDLERLAEEARAKKETIKHADLNRWDRIILQWHLSDIDVGRY